MGRRRLEGTGCKDLGRKRPFFVISAFFAVNPAVQRRNGLADRRFGEVRHIEMRGAEFGMGREGARGEWRDSVPSTLDTCVWTLLNIRR